MYVPVELTCVIKFDLHSLTIKNLLGDAPTFATSTIRKQNQLGSIGKYYSGRALKI